MNQLPRRAAWCCLLALAAGLCARSGADDTPPTKPERPRYGGTLTVGTVYVGLSALSWDPADWNWKVNHDTGMIYEQLFAADLSQAPHRGGDVPFHSEGWIPPRALRGELAERWTWEDPLTLIVHLRRGVRYRDRPGLMAARELDAHDVVWSFERLLASPKAIRTYFDYVDTVSARDDHTVVVRLRHWSAEWDHRFGYGYYSAILPRELAAVDPRDWRNLAGTGPFELERYLAGNSQIYRRNPEYWDHEEIGGERYRLPFVERVIYRTIKDEATQHTALRTAKIDILETVSWLAVEYLERTTPELRWARTLSSTGQFIALRTDRPPFDDRRVRRALNLAIDKREIVELYYGGHAELFAYPMHPEFEGYFEPLEVMPPSVQQLFRYDPTEARRLLAAAGLADGFRFTLQISTIDADHVALAQLLAGYLAKVGVVAEIQPMDYGSFLSAMTTKTHAAGYLMRSGHVSPTASLRKSFATGQVWNPSMWSDPELDRRIEQLLRTRDEGERQRMVKRLVAEMVDQAPYVWLPTPYQHIGWWPWVKNYGGELRAGAVRPGPIYARLWIDQELKRKLGFASR